MTQIPAPDRKNFFDLVRKGLLGPTLSPTEVDGCNVILDAFLGKPVCYQAYALATAYLETNHTMQPVREAYWLSDSAANAYFFRMYDPLSPLPNRRLVAKRLGNTQPGDGAKFPGMGYCQTTGRKNYTVMDEKIGLDGHLVTDPKIMMHPDNAAKAMFIGMTEGLFTGKKLSDYKPDDYFHMREIINGHDRAQDIADFALHFQAAVEAIH